MFALQEEIDAQVAEQCELEEAYTSRQPRAQRKHSNPRATEHQVLSRPVLEAITALAGVELRHSGKRASCNSLCLHVSCAASRSICHHQSQPTALNRCTPCSVDKERMMRTVLANNHNTRTHGHPQTVKPTDRVRASKQERDTDRHIIKAMTHGKPVQDQAAHRAAQQFDLLCSTSQAVATGVFAAAVSAYAGLSTTSGLSAVPHAHSAHRLAHIRTAPNPKKQARHRHVSFVAEAEPIAEPIATSRVTSVDRIKSHKRAHVHHTKHVEHFHQRTAVAAH
jgi:hypothetical protein